MADYLEEKVEKRLGDGLQALFGELCIYFKFKPFGIIGVPDRIVLLPGGRLIFVELKKPDGIVKPWQGRMHTRLRDMGFEVRVIFTLEQVDEFLQWLS